MGTSMAEQKPVIVSLLDLQNDGITVPEAKYLVGWSHGKESLKAGSYDTLKGSYYVNCAFYKDPSFQNAPAEGFPNFSEYTHPNVWPPESVLPGFKETFKELCILIIDTAVLVARACDRYAAAHIDDYPSGYLECVVINSLTTKARLLHYFPSRPPETTSLGSGGGLDDEEDSWCATHLDHGCLTGLTSAMFVNEKSSGSPAPFTAPLPPPSTLPYFPSFRSPPDPSAGLYICSRTGNTTKVSIPTDCLAFQTGEALEVITQGRFRAVPHFVKAPKPSADGDRVARNTLAVFTQPNLGEVVDREKGTTFGQFARGVVDRHTYREDEGK
ncbi:MAG: hypothetical protein MMC33_000182 [Icmadophila ericetorum]|nr:hypothetical protein [Icmadophila ericetorum]